jgi:hypothetical protein
VFSSPDGIAGLKPWSPYVLDILDIGDVPDPDAPKAEPGNNGPRNEHDLTTMTGSELPSELGFVGGTSRNRVELLVGPSF